MFLYEIHLEIKSFNSLRNNNSTVSHKISKCLFLYLNFVRISSFIIRFGGLLLLFFFERGSNWRQFLLWMFFSAEMLSITTYWKSGFVGLILFGEVSFQFPQAQQFSLMNSTKGKRGWIECYGKPLMSWKRWINNRYTIQKISKENFHFSLNEKSFSIMKIINVLTFYYLLINSYTIFFPHFSSFSLTWL